MVQRIASNAMKREKQGAKRSRATLNKQIAAAPTLAEKSDIALSGGQPAFTEIQMLSWLTALQSPCPYGEVALANTVKAYKQKVADLLFPALVNNDIQIFEELILAMKEQRRNRINLEKALRSPPQDGNPHKYKPSKKEIGRLLRLALLYLHPDDLLNIQTVRSALEKEESSLPDNYRFFSDDSKIYAVMKELKIRFLKPGDKAEWRAAGSGQVLRQLQILPDGTPKETGMTLEEISLVKNKNVLTNFP